MQLASKLLEQVAVNTRPKNEKHMLIVMDKSTHEEHIYNHCKLIMNNLKLQSLF